MKVKIKRFRSGEEFWEEYEVEGEGLTVLEILRIIKEEIDPTLSFRAFCRAGICGTCGLKVNGEHKLACSTRVYGDVTLEPPDGYPVIKDLVVDHSPLYENLKKGRVWMRPACANVPVKPADLKKTGKSHDCILCGICNSVCPVLAQRMDFGFPSTFTKAYGVIYDPRNEEGEKKLSDLLPLNIQNCTHCRYCSMSCPKSCDPELLIKIMENAMQRYGLIKKQEQDFGFLGF